MNATAAPTRHGVGLCSKALCVVLTLLLSGVWMAMADVPGAAAAEPPPAPTGLVPSSGDVTANPVLHWDATPGATSYKVLVKTDPGGVTVSGANNQTVYSNNFAFQNDLALGSYAWNVTAVGPGGQSNSSGGTFTKVQVGGPTLRTPANGSSIEYPSQNPTFSWDPIVGVKTYTLEISSDSAFSQTSTDKYTTQATSFTPTVAQPFGTTYYWRVTGTYSTSSVNTGVSDVWSYTIGWGPNGLAAPTPLAPSNDATNSVHDVVLKWSPVAGAATYEVQVSPNQDWANNLSFDVVTDSTLYAPAKSLDNGNYFWRVRATTVEGGQSQWSAIWQFRRVPMQKVSLLSPANSGSGGPTQAADLFLSWNPVPEASAYQLQISADPNFSSVNTSQTCITNHTDWGPYRNESNVGASVVAGPGGSSACPMNRADLSALFAAASDNVTVYWRVRGLDYYASNELPDPWNSARTPINGPWSDVWSFQYHATLGAPVLLSPTPGASVTVPRMQWSTVPGAEYYQVIVTEYTRKWNANTSTCDDDNSSTTTYKTSATSYVPSLKLPAALPPTPKVCASRFAWTVNAVNGVSHTSPTPLARSFELVGPDTAGASGTITATATQDPTLPGQVSFDWNPVPGADHYVVRWFAGGGNTFTELGDVNRGVNDPRFYPYTSAFTTTQLQNAGTAAYQIAAIDAGNQQITASAVTPITVAWPVVQPIGPTNCVPTNAVCQPEPTTPVLNWTQVAGASFYRVIIAYDVGFTNKVRQYLTPQHELRSVEALPDNQAGQAYYWFVQACRNDWKTSSFTCGINETSPSAIKWAFQKRSAPIAGAKTLQPTSPTPNADSACGASGLTTVSDQPTLCWNGYGGTIDNDVAAMLYHVQVATDSTFSAGSMVDDYYVDQASYTPYRDGSKPTSIRHRTYPEGALYWRVQARDATGNYLTWSPTQAIVKSSPRVTLVSPSDNATVSASPSLAWQAKTFAAKYTVEIYKNGDTNWSSTNLVRSQITDLTAYSATQGGGAYQSLPQGTYAWRVRAIDANNLPGAWSSGRVFTVSPGAPTLLTPTSGQSISTPTVLYTWTAVAGAVSYRVVESVNGNLTSPFENKVSYSTSWAPLSNIPNGTIYWQVQALDGQGSLLGTSAVSSFSYTSSRPTASRPTGVTANAAVALSWTASPASASLPITDYQVRVYVGASVVRTDTVSVLTAGPPTGATYTVNNLVNNTTYTFTVTPVDGNGPGTESQKSVNLVPQQWAPFSSATNCVKRLYADLAAVPNPSAMQVNLLTGYISSGHSCAETALLLWNQGTFQDLFGISRLYQAYFLRIPDYGGINYWAGLHRTNGLTLSSMSSYFAQSAEFISTYGRLNNTGFLSLIYRNVLNRAPDQDGFNYWLDLLNRGRINRGDVMLLFSESFEYRTTQMATMKADLLILEFLRRTPTQAEVDHYAPLLPYLGTSAQQVAQMDADLLTQIEVIMSSLEYKTRAN